LNGRVCPGSDQYIRGIWQELKTYPFREEGGRKLQAFFQAVRDYKILRGRSLLDCLFLKSFNNLESAIEIDGEFRVECRAHQLKLSLRGHQGHFVVARVEIAMRFQEESVRRNHANDGTGHRLRGGLVEVRRHLYELVLVAGAQPLHLRKKVT
jgi:hypothetical protein